MTDGEQVGRVELADDRKVFYSSSWNSACPPETSLIIACYKVSRYLPAFLASLDAQTVEHSNTELVFVIDGCPEASEEIVRGWMQETDYQVCLVSQKNAGVAAARNVGLDLSRGVWVSSPDPDDVLESSYLSEIERARAIHPSETMFVARIRFISPEGHEQPHPLDFKIRDGRRRVVDLSQEPESIQTLGGVVFFDARRIRNAGLRMRLDLPTASDADFIMRYLLAIGARYVLVPEAHYRYHRRADDSSIVKTQEKNVARYRTVFGVTHRSLLELAGPQCPQWLANTILYFVFYLFNRNRSAHSLVYATDDETLSTIRQELKTNLKHIGVSGVTAFRVHNLPLDMRAAWIAAASECSVVNSSYPDPPVERHDYDEKRGVLRVSFVTRSATPPRGLAANCTNEGKEIEILAGKTRSIEYLGAVWAYEHILLLSTVNPDAIKLVAEPGFEFALDGRALPVGVIRDELGMSKPVSCSERDDVALAHTGHRSRVVVDRVRARSLRLKYALSLRLERLRGRATGYNSALVFDLGSGPRHSSEMSLEGFFRAAVADPCVNVWAVLDAADPRYAAMRAEGLPIVGSGSMRHFLLLKRAEAVVSLEREYLVPFPEEVIAKSWRFVYLPPNKLAKHDYWELLPWAIDLVAADNADEAGALADEGSCYWFNRDEVLRLDGYRERLSQHADADARTAAAASAVDAAVVRKVAQRLGLEKAHHG